MNKFSIFLIIASIQSNIFSQFVTINDANTVAKNAFFENTFSSKATKLEIIDIIKVDTIPLLYIFGLKNDTGFIIISAYDQIEPVIGYSNNSIWIQNDIPPQLSSILHTSGNKIIEKIKSKYKGSIEVENDWAKYRSNKFVPTKSINTSVSPLLTTTWDQRQFYNCLCPLDNAGYNGRVPAGCVATAMGQVMKKWNYPSTGNSSFSYTDPANVAPYDCTDPSYGTLSASFGSTTYNWANMPNSISSDNISIGTLLYHSGISVSTNYSFCGSGADNVPVPGAFIDYFKYFLNAQLVSYDGSYTSQQWTNLLKNELNNGRPLVYFARDWAG
jgi:hypothetical protein